MATTSAKIKLTPSAKIKLKVPLTQADPSPTERLAYADLSDEELLANIMTVQAAVAAAQQVLDEGARREEAMRDEIMQRAKEKHEEAAAAIKCPNCGPRTMEQVMYCSSRGYDVSDLNEHEGGAFGFDLHDYDATDDLTVIVMIDGEAVQAELRAAALCRACGEVWPWNENLRVNWA